MKLCIISASIMKGDGQGRVNYEIVQRALQQNFEVTLVVRQIDTEIKKHKLVKSIQFPLEKVPIELIRGILFAFLSDNWLQKHRDEFDVVMSCGSVISSPTDVNVVHFVHGSWLNSPFHTYRMRKDLYGIYQWLYTAVNAQTEKKAFKNTQAVIAVSNKVKSELVSIGVPSDRIQVILNGVSTEEFYPDVKISRSELGLPLDVDLALFVGDIRTNRKNLDSVLKALSQLPHLHLAVVGNTTNSPYPQMAKNLNLEERVHFLGFRRDIAKIMRVTDFFVFPSRYEACTLVLLEAMASGLPIITAKTAGGAELVSAECGFVLEDPEDIAALGKAMEALQGDRQLREKMGLAARYNAEQHTWLSKSSEYLNLFDSMAKGLVVK